MIYENIELTRQVATAHWGWTIAFFLWFVGLGGMTLVLNAFAKSRHLFFAATGAIVVGTLLVVSHLARLLNLPFAAINALLEWKFNFGSWMFIGICILAVTCVVTVVQAWLWWKGSRVADSKGMLFIDAVLGFASTAYSGFLLTQAVGVPLWTTAVLPVLWVFSGLSSAVGLMEVERLCPKSDTKDISWLGHVAHLAHWGEAFVLFAFVSVAFSGTPAPALRPSFRATTPRSSGAVRSASASSFRSSFRGSATARNRWERSRASAPSSALSLCALPCSSRAPLIR